MVHNTGVETIAGAKTFSSNMTLNGNLVVNGNITQSGTAYETHAEQVYVKQQVIWLRDGGSGQMTNYAGMIARLYDGVNSGGIIFDSNGVARVGDVAQDSSGNILKGDTQAIATRQDSPSSYGVPYWNATSLRFDTLVPGTAGRALLSGGTSSAPVWAEVVTLDTAQTISGAKTFSATRTTMGKEIAFTDTTNPYIKMTTGDVDFYFQSSGGEFGLGPTWAKATTWNANGVMTVKAASMNLGSGNISYDAASDTFTI